MDRLFESKINLIRRISTFGSKSRTSSLSELASLSSVQTSQETQFPSGVKVLYEPQDPVVDVVFVHGLTGDRERTWTHPGNGVCWPRDILPQNLPDARILTFGYDAYVVRARDQVASIDIAHHANDFLNCLANERMDSQSAKRPLILVAHSLGGLLCKDAMRLSQNNAEARLGAIFEHVQGIIFIATPHGGSWLAKWAKTSASLLGVLKIADVSLLSLLKTDSEVLNRINDDFLSMLIRRQADHRSIRIACFYEVLPLRGRIKIVDKDSATISGYNNVSIHADHRNIARFKSQDDPGYKHITGTLGMWVNESSDVSSSAEIDGLLESLSSPEMGVRMAAIEPAEKGTCEWLGNHPTYKDWASHRRLEESHGLLWIKGKVGCGKSTIVKHIFLRPSSKACRIAFFFNARGGPEEKNAYGLFKALLHQVVGNYPHLSTVLIKRYKLKKRQSGKADVLWSLPELRELLHDVILNAGKTPIEIFVDALDECNETEIRSVVTFFSWCSSDAIAHNTTLRICWSSRHYRHVSVQHHFQILVENMNSADITLWVQRHLAGGDHLWEHFGAQIVAKANGIFLWSVLVVNKIRKLADKGLPNSKISRVIDDMPSELNELYRNVLETLDPDLTEDAIAMISCVLFAFEPLEVDSIRFIMEFMGKKPPKMLKHLEGFAMEKSKFALYVTEVSGGLLEVITTESGRPSTLEAALSQKSLRRSIVQPIHESASNFLLNQGLLRLLKVNEDWNVRQNAHLQIYQACARILSTREMRCVLLRPKRFFSHTPKLVESGRQWLGTPLLNYVMKRIFKHLEEGCASISSGFYAVRNTSGVLIARSSVIDTMRNWMSVNAVMFMSRRRLDRLAEALSMEWEMNELDFCALDDHSGLCALLQHGEHPNDNELDKVIIALAHHGLDEQIVGYIKRQREANETPPFSRFSGIALESAIKGHHYSTVKLLMENGEIQRPIHLILAIQQGQVDIVHHLLKNGGSANQSAMGKIPLIEAISVGRIDIVNKLFDYGAEINREYKGNYAICEAVNRGRGDIVQTLLDHGAAATYAGSNKIPINQAVSLGFEAIAELLLKHGASVSMYDDEGETALMKAEKSSRETMIQLVRHAKALQDAAQNRDLEISSLVAEQTKANHEEDRN
ncbi:uncharacterized protein A1O9_00341 [Exophiala aquamarina CBS 119918]|uniref:Nephrocystin 3-like N-terminal domain-containing protein n=1 Tax=Exophiala aquamarina CBS 119918 TaxID=1182545 RepID=A0A072PQJ9_9EURO|nr:uncharacterized protein A1O9_00341 [Exophiala aquamarina CBS 119918]KEF62369.1 hypothetical protein A1O9_00341 [Exophiala aquamarina CBS 119918]